MRNPRRDPRRLALFVWALVIALWYAALFAALPWPVLARRLGRAAPPAKGQAALDAHDPTPSQRAAAERAKWAVGAVRRRLPFTLWCSPQALTALALMRGRAPSVLFIGHLPDTSVKDSSPHAWLISGDVRVTGFPEARRHTPMAAYLFD